MITLAQLTLDHVQSVKGKYHATATEVKRIREIIASGKLATHTQFKINRKDFFFSIEDGKIVVKVGDKQTYTWGGQPEYRTRSVYVNLKEGYTVLSQDEVNELKSEKIKEQNETDAIINMMKSQHESQVHQTKIDGTTDEVYAHTVTYYASELTCDVLDGWVGKSSPLPEPEAKEDLTAKLLDISHRLGRTFEGDDIASDIRFAEVIALCNNNDKLFWECRGSWYEGNNAKQQNQPATPTVEKIIIHWPEASGTENTEFTSVAAAMEEMRSWYGNHPENLPQKGQGYDKTNVTVIFSNGDKYQNMRLDICAHDDDDNPFSSENVFYSHYRAWLECLKNGAWAKDEAHRQEMVKECSVFLNYDWGTGLEPIFNNVVNIKRSQAIANHVKIRYEAWVMGLLEKGESHKIVSFDEWKRSVNFA